MAFVTRNAPVKGSEPIYTGKQVNKYTLAEPITHLVFNRANLQQVAPDEIYRSSQKLVYKTINKNLKFAFDGTQSLTTNSANIVIPQIPGYDILSVMAFLNSDLYSFLHLKLFGGVNKIAKENLMALPFPKLDAKSNSQIIKLVRGILNGDPDGKLQNYIHFDVFGLTKEDVAHIRSVISN